MIYLSKYQHHPAPLAVEAMGSDSRGLERSCGGIEEVLGKRDTQTRFNPSILPGATHKPVRKFLLPVKAMVLVVVLLTSVSVAMSADRFSVASGAWTSTAVWSATSGGIPGATAPVAADNVFIEGGFTLRLMPQQLVLTLVSPAHLLLQWGLCNHCFRNHLSDRHPDHIFKHWCKNFYWIGNNKSRWNLDFYSVNFLNSFDF